MSVYYKMFCTGNNNKTAIPIINVLVYITFTFCHSFIHKILLESFIG